MAAGDSENVKPGEQTTELKEASSAKVWAIIGVVLGFLLEVGGGVVNSLDMSGNALILSGAILQAISLFRATLVQLGYIKSRENVKVAAELAKPNE